ncbi:MAG: sulfur carrier protein ThiS [Chloroflexi bacterium]|nr:sulfur carrier protein ThiS [Chloroflexota bacterium]
MITLTVNGQPRQVPEPMTVARFLQQSGITHPFIAVARNGDVLHRDEYDRVVVQNGDTLEIVRMVGGGG